MGEKIDDRKGIANQHILRAKKSLQSAKELLKNELYEDSISRAYFSAYHAAYAIRYFLGFSPRTHKGLQNLFFLHIIQTGILPQKSLKTLARLMDERTNADYGIIPILENEDVIRAIEDAEKFIAMVEEALSKLYNAK